MKFFNTAGPINPEMHYYVTHRLDEREIYTLIDQQKYFALHAPRQSGKTTSLREFAKQLNKEGQYKALYVNIENAQVARNHVERAMLGILQAFALEIKFFLDTNEDQAILNHLEVLLQSQVSTDSLEAFLTYWASQSKKPIILFIDEIDSLVGDSLIAVLRQLRSGYTRRPKSFPSSVCLIGVRDVRDYHIWSPEQNSIVLGGSAFNIKAESLTLPDFSEDQVRNLYEQHTLETGQKFTSEALKHAFYLTRGQPWLVNALAYQACFRDVVDRKVDITKEIIERSKEALIKRRDTHIDVLMDRLKEPRVRIIVDAILGGSDASEAFPLDDINYVRDLGLLARTGKELVIANPIYQQIIPRELTYTTQLNMRYQYGLYQNKDGTLNMNLLLKGFQEFYKKNSVVWLEKFDYKESGRQLLMMAFLQRIVNGDGTIHREYSLGSDRIDILLCWKEQRIVIELKILRNGKTLSDGLNHTDGYMGISEATEGHLIIFDCNSNHLQKNKNLENSSEDKYVKGKKITVWDC